LDNELDIARARVDRVHPVARRVGKTHHVGEARYTVEKWVGVIFLSGTVIGSCATLARDEFPRPAADRGAQKPVQRLFHALFASSTWLGAAQTVLTPLFAANQL